MKMIKISKKLLVSFLLIVCMLFSVICATNTQYDSYMSVYAEEETSEDVDYEEVFSYKTILRDWYDDRVSDGTINSSTMHVNKIRIGA